MDRIQAQAAASRDEPCVVLKLNSVHRGRHGRSEPSAPALGERGGRPRRLLAPPLAPKPACRASSHAPCRFFLGSCTRALRNLVLTPENIASGEPVANLTAAQAMETAAVLADAAVLFAMYSSQQHVGSRRVVLEGVEAARQLRRIQPAPAVPLVLYANAHAIARLPEPPPFSSPHAPWDARHEIDLHPRVRAMLAARPPAARRAVMMRAAPYLFKLSSLLHVPARRVLFLDCDVLVLQPLFVHGMLIDVLHVADVAMPLDPGREPHLTQGRPPWATQTAGPPPLCSAVLAYRRTNATDELWLGAASRLVHARHTHARQGDQEMIWFEWVHGPSSQRLRVTALPEEYYCPLEHRQPPPRNLSHGVVWHTSWRRGIYRCRAVHGHGYFHEAARYFEHEAGAFMARQQQRAQEAGAFMARQQHRGGHGRRERRAAAGHGRRLSSANSRLGQASGSLIELQSDSRKATRTLPLKPAWKPADALYPLGAVCELGQPSARSYHSYWAVPPAVQFIADQSCGVHPLLSRGHTILPVTRVSGVSEIDQAETGLWFYVAYGCSDFAWYTGRSLLARNKQDLLVTLAGQWSCVRKLRRHRRALTSARLAACTLNRPQALRHATRWLLAAGRPYADELLNRSRHDHRVDGYFRALASRTAVNEGGDSQSASASTPVTLHDAMVDLRRPSQSLGEHPATSLGVRRTDLALSVLIDDAAQGTAGGGEESARGGQGDGQGGGRSGADRLSDLTSGCNVHVASSSPRRCTGACLQRRQALAFAHQREGLLDAVNERLLKRLVGTPFEVDTVALHHQPQGMFSLRTHAELWDVRHLHSEYRPEVPGFRTRPRAATDRLTDRLARKAGAEGEADETILRPYALANGSAAGCRLWAGWRQCLACEGSESHRACSASTRVGREWYADGARGMLAPASPTECGGLPPQAQSTDACKAARLATLFVAAD